MSNLEGIVMKKLTIVYTDQPSDNPILVMDSQINDFVRTTIADFKKQEDSQTLKIGNEILILAFRIAMKQKQVDFPIEFIVRENNRLEVLGIAPNGSWKHTSNYYSIQDDMLSSIL